MFQQPRLEEEKKPSHQIDVQTVNLTALHPLTPGEDGSGSRRVEKVQWKESALEVLKLDFPFFSRGIKKMGRRKLQEEAVGGKEERELIC